MANEKTNVLVVLATGKMGKCVIDAFLANGTYNVFGTSRNANHRGLKAKGVTPVAFKFGDKQSMVDAIKKSGATIVFLNTEFQNAAKQCADTESQHGIVMVDACREQGVSHVIHCSVLLADSAPLEHFRSKVPIEQRLAASGVPYTVLRPASFFDNFDDAVNWNPLTRGKLSGLFGENSRVPLVACADVATAAVNVAGNRSQWVGKTIDCVSCNATMKECAEGLSMASGVPCPYKVAMPSFMLWMMSRDYYNMAALFANRQITDDAAPFRALVGNSVKGPTEYFAWLGRWGNGDKFGEPAKKATSMTPLLVVGAATVLVVAIVASKMAN
jgi:uncharacterized protein YbjT (DUF2867 family)